MATHDFDLRKANNTRIQAVMADLKVGLTLVRIALSSRSRSERRQRNRANARKAYDSVVQFRKDLILTSAEEQVFNSGLTQLKSLLEQLGESF